MALRIHMDAPICFIENLPDGKLLLQDSALGVLSQIQQPVVVVAVVGLYRTGKSYLMNRLAGKRKGFSLGAEVQAKTKGIWMWCVPHPFRPDRTLVLLDTEGLGDVQKANTQNDSWIFALAILLSSTLVYNSMGTIDQNSLEKLQYVTELTKKIRTKSSDGYCEENENAAEFVRFFPDFVWTVRDLTLQMMINGRPITDDEYLESALKLQQGYTEQIEKSNIPRYYIRKFFPKRKCFTFDRPTGRKNLQRLDELQDSDLEEEFLEPANRFCQYVWETSRTKTIPGGREITGPMLARLAENYLVAINSGHVPCLENAVLDLAKIENSAAVREAMSCYEECMNRQLVLPTNTVEELLQVQAECEREATKAFMARAFGSNIKLFQTELQAKLQEKKEEFCKRNEEVSSARCQAVLVELSQELEDGICNKIYAVRGGYLRYLEKQNEIEMKYRSVPGKGIQADKVLEEYLKTKQTVAQSILQMDEALSAHEKEIEAERARTQATELQNKLMEQDQAKLMQMVADQQRSHEEQLSQLNEKIEWENQLLAEENERMLQHKLKEHEELLKDGFQQKANEMESEIERLKQQNHPLSVGATILEKLIEPLPGLASQVLQYAMFSKLAGLPKGPGKWF